MLRPGVLLLLALAASACGASTGLREGDAGDAGPDVQVAIDRPINNIVGPWERCFVGDTCSGGTTCQVTTYNANGVAARMCTRDCSRSAPCPNRGVHSSFQVGCATATPATGEGQCYEICESDANCGAGTRCLVRSGLPLQLCLPVGEAR